MINVKPNTCIHVKTQEEYNELMKELEDLGYRTNCFFDKLTGRKMYFDNGNGLVCFDEEDVKNKVFYFRKCGNQKEGYTIEEYRPEFRVGGMVEKINFSPGDTIVEGTRGVITRKSNDSDFDWQIKYDGFEEKELAGREENLKLIYRAEEPKTEESRPLFSTSHYFNEENLKKAEEMLELYENNPMQNYWCGKSLTERMVGHLKKQRDLQKASLEENLRIFNKLNSFNKSNKKTFMSNIIANAFKSKEDKALEGLGLGTTKELNQSGREEYVNFLFETDGKGTKEEFFSKIVEAYNDTKK
jgi:hypothetical protein